MANKLNTFNRLKAGKFVYLCTQQLLRQNKLASIFTQTKDTQLFYQRLHYTASIQVTLYLLRSPRDSDQRAVRQVFQRERDGQADPSCTGGRGGGGR